VTDSSYPSGKDEIRKFVSGVSDMVAQDLNDMFDVAVAIEEELGVEPSGRLGTVLSRLFARGNLSRNDGRWRRLQWGIMANLPSWKFDENGPRFRLPWTKNRWFGVSSDLGDDRPVPFVQLQATAPQYQAWPWQINCFAVEETHAEFWARDALMARVWTNNNRGDVKIAWLLWGMI